MKHSIELKKLLCYIIDTKEQPPTRWFDQFNNEIEIPPFHSPKFQGWFFYVELLTKRKNECKQCQKKQTKSQQILKIKMIFHRHHPHSLEMKVNTPCITIVPCSVFYHNYSCLTMSYNRHIAILFASLMFFMPLRFYDSKQDK